jgi:hypothetical protein
MSSNFSAEYIQLRQRGAFVGRIDPFAEAGCYFQQVHSGMINHLQDQMQDELNLRGYQAGKEASLQIFAQRQPDLYIENTAQSRPTVDLDYDAVAAALQVAAGTEVLTQEPELEALHITDMNTGKLVTVIEIISSRNKTHIEEMLHYQKQRQHLFIDNQVNVVEIDPTRSVRHLISHPLVDNNPYHIAVYIPNKLPRIIESRFEESLKPFALPLIGEGIRVEPQQAYDRAYQRGAIAGLILQEGQYARDVLPFPSTLSETQIENALKAVAAWQAELQRLEGT